MARGAPLTRRLCSAAAAAPLLLALLTLAPPTALALSPGIPSPPAPVGIVTGVAGAEAQAEFSAAEGAWAGSRRTLLHGKRRPTSYSICPVCTAVTCTSADNTCSGHCKKSRTLFTCKIKGRIAYSCDAPDDSKPAPTPADMVPKLDSVWVRVTAPFVGCANVSNSAEGCPEPGTTGTLNGEGVTVLSSSCTQHLHKLPCPSSGDDDPPTLFYPFGYCVCWLQFDSGSVARGPCQMSYLDWSGPAGGQAGMPVRVAPDGAVTRTTIGVTDESDPGTYTLRHTFSSQEGPIDAELLMFSHFAEKGYDILAEGPLPEEEEAVFREEAEEEEESALGKFLRGFTPK